MRKEEFKQLMDESFYKAGEYNDAIREYYEEVKKSGRMLTKADLEQIKKFRDGWNKEMKSHMEAARKYFSL